MRTHTALAALLIAAASVVQVPAFAESEPQAHLRLVVVDQASAPLAAAKVTVYTTDGRPGIDLTADRTGTVALGALPTGFAQIHVRHAGHGSYAEAVTLKRGANHLTVTLASR